MTKIPPLYFGLIVLAVFGGLPAAGYASSRADPLDPSSPQVLAGLPASLASLSPATSRSQSLESTPAPILRFERLSSAEGLSFSWVTSILQDEQGFMWFGTLYGLNKYDGFNFSVYTPERGGDVLTGNFISDLYQDRAGDMWLATRNGLTRLDRKTGTFGLEGGSQAGYVMSLVLSTSQDIAFVICNSCPGMSGVDQSTYQAMALALCTGTPEGQADRRQELLAELDATRTYETYAAYVHYREVIEALFGTASNIPRGYGFEVVPEEAWRLNDPEKEGWWDPMEVIRHTTIPVLVLLGDQDRRMDPLQAAVAWRQALEEAGNPNSHVELFSNANHDLIVSENGCPDDDLRWLEEYVQARGYESLAAAMAAIQENPSLMSQFPFAPGYLDLIEEWLTGLRVGR